MRNIAPSHRLERRSRQLLEIAFMMVAAGVFLAVLGMAFYVVPLTSPSSRAYPTFNTLRALLFLSGVIISFVGVLLGVRAITQRRENTAAKRTGEFLAQHIQDQQYVFIRNISRRKLGYIDAMLVGPPGVLVLRILEETGVFLNEEGHWVRANRRGEWRPLRFSNPTRDTIKDIEHLRAYMASHKLDNIPIFGVIVFMADDPAVKLTLKNPRLPATHLTSLPKRLREHYLAEEKRIDVPTIRAIVNLFAD